MSLLPERSKSAPRSSKHQASGSKVGSYPIDDDRLLKRFQKRLDKGGSTSTTNRKEWTKDRLVSLLNESQLAFEDEDQGYQGDDFPRPSSSYAIVGGEPTAPPEPPPRGRIAIHCTANAYDLKGLASHLRAAGYRCDTFPEVLYSRYIHRASGQSQGDILLFEYGVVVFWSLTPKQERNFLDNTLKGRFEMEPLAAQYVERDTFFFQYVPYATPTLNNDIITIAPNLKDAHLTKISISLALSQSTKLSVLEDRVGRMANITRDLPNALAKKGQVEISAEDIAKLMGRVFLEQMNLNLLGSVLDTPQFFNERGIPDTMGQVYDRVWEYLELEDRIEVLNNRLQVLHSMFEMLRNQQSELYSEKLEWIIIWLVAIDLVVLLLQLVATAGYFDRR